MPIKFFSKTIFSLTLYHPFLRTRVAPPCLNLGGLARRVDWCSPPPTALIWPPLAIVAPIFQFGLVQHVFGYNGQR